MTTFCKRLLSLTLTLLIWTAANSQLSGTYTLGSSNADYATLTDAVDALQNEGVSGPVVFEVSDGTYTEEVDFLEVDGASASNTITFQSATGDSSQVIFEKESDGSTPNFGFDNASHYVMQGITFHNTSQADNWRVVSITGNCANLTFTNCQFSSAIGEDDNLILGAFDYLEKLTIRNCYFKRSDQAIELNPNDSCENISVQNNTFATTEEAVDVDEVRNITITNNHLPNVINDGIAVDNFSGEAIINNNFIDLSNEPYDGKGLVMEHAKSWITSVSLQNNHIIGDIDDEGLYIDDISLAGNTQGIIANNIISGFEDNLIIESLINFLVVHNSIYAFDDNDLAVEAKSNGNIIFKNNIIVHNTINDDPAFEIDDTSSIGSSDFNIYHVLNNDFSNLGATLSDFQSATELDSNSQSMNPNYWDGEAGDLRICNDSLFQAGTGISRVSTDIYGRDRDPNNPTPGAVELMYDYTDARADFSYQQNGMEVTFANETKNLADFKWEFGDGDTSIQKNPVHTYSSNDSFQVTLYANSACGSDTAYATIDLAVSGISNKIQEHFTVYPNPTNGKLNVEVDHPAEMKSIRLRNTVGEVVYSSNFKRTLEIGHLPVGIYIMEVQSRSGKAVVRKVVKE